MAANELEKNQQKEGKLSKTRASSSSACCHKSRTWLYCWKWKRNAQVEAAYKELWNRVLKRDNTKKPLLKNKKVKAEKKNRQRKTGSKQASPQK